MVSRAQENTNTHTYTESTTHSGAYINKNPGLHPTDVPPYIRLCSQTRAVFHPSPHSPRMHFRRKHPQRFVSEETYRTKTTLEHKRSSQGEGKNVVANALRHRERLFGTSSIWPSVMFNRSRRERGGHGDTAHMCMPTVCTREGVGGVGGADSDLHNSSENSKKEREKNWQ